MKKWLSIPEMQTANYNRPIKHLVICSCNTLCECSLLSGSNSFIFDRQRFKRSVTSSILFSICECELLTPWIYMLANHRGCLWFFIHPFQGYCVPSIMHMPGNNLMNKLPIWKGNMKKHMSCEDRDLNGNIMLPFVSQPDSYNDIPPTMMILNKSNSS